MPKQFLSFDEVIQDDLFNKHVARELSKACKERNARPKPKPGFHYVKDWYDRMLRDGELNRGFILKHIKAVWEKKSPLTSERRRVVEIIGNLALKETFKEYEEKEKLKEAVVAKVEELQVKPKVRKPRTKKVTDA